MSKSHDSNEPPWHAGLRSARANLVPGIVLQCFALTLVLAYYYHESTRAAVQQLAEFRADTGWAFAIVSTAFFGAIIPLLYLRIRRVPGECYSWPQSLWLIAFWAYKGLEVDLFYHFLAHAIGEGHEAGTIGIKMFIDQFIYCPLIAVPVTVVVYAWCESHFNTATLVADIRAPHWYRRRVLPLLISNLGVWLPAVAIIYSLPTALQLPLQNLVLCFYTLLISHQTRNTAQP